LQLASKLSKGKPRQELKLHFKRNGEPEINFNCKYSKTFKKAGYYTAVKFSSNSRKIEFYTDVLWKVCICRWSVVRNI